MYLPFFEKIPGQRPKNLIRIQLGTIILVVFVLYYASIARVRFHQAITWPHRIPRVNICDSYAQKPPRLQATESFERIDGAESSYPCLLAFSAYFDTRHNTVQVITDAATACYTTIQLLCILWYDEYVKPFVNELKFHYTTGKATERRIAAVYYCKTPLNAIGKPYAVSFSTQSPDCGFGPIIATKAIPARYNQNNTFAVCVPPLFGTVRPMVIIEFLEIHKLLGAEKFYFYSENVSSEVNAVLKAYVHKGIVEVIKWQLFSMDEIHYHGQEAMQPDCMYRNMHVAKYVAQIDIDEVLLPRKESTWLQLIKSSEEAKTASFMFLNRFYSTEVGRSCLGNHSQWPCDFNITFLNRVQYYTLLFGAYERSKFIYKPELIDRVYTHYAEPIRGFNTKVLDIQQGLLQHYRTPIQPRYTNGKQETDYNLCRFDQALIELVRRAVADVCGNAGSLNNSICNENCSRL